MTISQKPQSLAYAADLNDYIIDSDASITFDVKKGNRFILKETYSPDGHFSIRTHRIGRFLADGLWGRWLEGTSIVQDKVMDDFAFLINGAVDTTSKVIASRCRVNEVPASLQALTLSNYVTVNIAAPFYISAMVDGNSQITAVVTDSNGDTYTVVLYSHVGTSAVVTVDASPSRVASESKVSNIYSYVIAGVKIVVDHTRYLDLHSFRFMNNFECPETVTATGSCITKGSQKSETAFMDGVERKFRISIQDEYTVNSGVIFSQNDYILWHELISARQVQALIDGRWIDIIIKKSKYERSYKKNLLKSVELTYTVADPNDIAEI